MRETQKQMNDNNGLKNTNFAVWRVQKVKKRLHDQDISRAYNARVRQRPDTKH